MDNHLPDDQLLTRYLLGQLSEGEAASVEVRFLSDLEYYEHLLMIEDELRCAFAQGSLVGVEREQFEKRFLTHSEERERVTLARAMLKELSGAVIEESSVLAAEAPRNEAKKSGWSEVLGTYFGFRSPKLAFAMVAVAVIAIVALSWSVIESIRLRRKVSQLQTQQATRENENARKSAEDRARLEQLNQELEQERKNRAELEIELASRPNAETTDQPSPSIVSLILSPGLVRGGGASNKLTLRQQSDQIRLLLKIDNDDASRTYRAEVLSSEGARVWGRDGLRGRRQFVVMTIPARHLAEDDYELNLTAKTKSGEREHVGDYYFTILRQR